MVLHSHIGWRPNFNLHIVKQFETYKQALHHLQEGETFGTVRNGFILGVACKE